MISLYGNTSFIREAFQNGAKAYLLKTELLTALPTALQTVADGNVYAPEVKA
jgi:DNA-binding NarL/FixJ family response regulator